MSHDIDLGPHANAAQLNPQDFGSFEAYISLDRLCRLMKSLAIEMQDDAVGLRYASFFKAGSTGPYGLGLRSAPTFRDMLNFYVRYSEIVSHSQTFAVTIAPEQFSVEWQYSPMIVHQRYFVDFTACLAVSLFADFANAPVAPISGQFMRRPPANQALYDAHFSSNITYGAGTNLLTFPSTLLALENPSANQPAFEYMSQQCDFLLENLKRPNDIASQVYEYLLRHPDRKHANMGEVAQRLGMSKRTLQRRLADAGTDLSRLSDETQDGMSLRLLCDTEQPVSAIARTLGYNSQSAYARWVKRLHGLSPTQLRQRLKNAPSTRPAWSR